MSENSKIEWTDHTFNPWIGCTKVSEGCAHCYAETQNKLRQWNPAGWGKGAPRKRTSAANWKEPLRWNKEAAICDGCGGKFSIPQAHLCPAEKDIVAGEDLRFRRTRVFCASLADWLDDEVPIEWLADLLALIHATPNLDWLLLTKRPENFLTRLRQIRDESSCLGHSCGMMAMDWRAGIAPENVWIGTSVENQQAADLRVPSLLSIPAQVRFLSCEPLLGPVEFSDVTRRSDAVSQLGKKALNGIHWVICGGEIGPHARPMHPDWARSLRDQCGAVGVPFFFKQWGCFRPAESADFEVASRCGWVALDGTTHSDNHPRIVTDAMMTLCSKSKAGRLLDGIEHNEFPKAGEGAK